MNRWEVEWGLEAVSQAAGNPIASESGGSRPASQRG